MRRFSIVLSVALGVIYIISGLLKLMDPVGTAFIVKEYFSFFGAGFADPAAMPAGIFLSVLEVLTGGLLAIRWRMNITASVSLSMMIFYSVLTLILMIFNPPMDCGCFGEAIHLTHTQTFVKNIVLLFFAIMPFLYRKVNSNRRKTWRNAYRMVLLAIMVTVTPVLSLMYRPFIDFTDFAPGAIIASSSKDGSFEEPEISLIYEKNGETAEFSIDNLPDSTWTYVETRTSLNESRKDVMTADFPLRDAGGNYMETYPDGGLFIISVHSPHKLGPSDWDKINMFSERALTARIPVYVAAGCDPASWEYSLTGLPVFFSDYKTLITFNRSNGGVVYLYTDNETAVIEKWAFRGMDDINVSDIATSDSDMMLMHATLRRSAFFQLTLFIYMLLMLL